MDKLRDGLPHATNGVEEHLDRVLMGLELLLARAGVSEPKAPEDDVVQLREPAAPAAGPPRAKPTKSARRK